MYSRKTMDSNLPSAPRTFVNTLAHAQSTPAGVDGSGTCTSKTPPATPKKSGKMLGVRVQMLDDSITVFQVQAKAVGRLLFDQVCKQLNLLEADYFGLEYQDATTTYWLDFEKPLHRQVGLSLVDPLLKFCVKFYTPYPAQLEEEYTRYLFCLQIKRDLLQGDLQCNDNTAALIISYIVQAECGDYTSEDYPDPSYLSYHKFVPHQDRELERKIMENHKKHVGQSPAEADVNLLETARRCELYGMIMHSAKDQEGVPLNLAVAHMGIVVFQNSTKINTFSWAKIRKISFKRKKFLIKLHPEGYGYYKDVVEFVFDNRNQCKSFWKKCVENHGFFRCSYVKRIPRQKARVLSRGSSFRYSGKTQKQMVAYVRENYVKRQTFQRSQSFRHQSSTHSSVVNVGASISAHPLLPLGENTIAGSGASLSCGSMTLSGSLSPTIAPEGGLPIAPTATAAGAVNACVTSTTSTQQSHQTPADVHEPATTSSDITSIASQSPPHLHHHDTGQKARYPYNFATNHFSEKLLLSTNTRAPASTTSSTSVATAGAGTGPSNRSNAKQRLRGAAVAVRAASTARVVADTGDGPAYDYDQDRDLDYNYNTRENFYTEFKFPMSTDSSKTITSVGRASGEKGANLAAAAATAAERENLDDPDILKDLGKPTAAAAARDEFAWQRSASCKELGMLYRQERFTKADGGVGPGSDLQRDQASKFDSFRYCYSCHGQTPCFDKSGSSGVTSSARDTSEMKVYSSSYPGTGSTPHTSLESGDEEPIPDANVFIMDDEAHVNVAGTGGDGDQNEDDDDDEDDDGDGDYKKTSQDDLSHDSYEVLEKERDERAFGSRSSSVESDEMFIMENDYRSVSKHILWREGSDDVEKRLGYVEPRYRNIGFNEFNEICKRGFAARNRDTSQSHGNIKFSEFGTKSDTAAGLLDNLMTNRNSVISAIVGHDMVSRTKSDPYMLKQKSSNKQKLYGLHQKSFELPATEFNDVVDDDRFATSKSTVDIPYTLRIRNAMNGTARNADEASAYETTTAMTASSASRSKSEVDLGSTAAAFVEDSKRSDHAASQDSGLSLSLGTESALDDVADIDLKNILLTKNSYEQVVTSKKSTKLMLSLSEENSENVASGGGASGNVSGDGGGDVETKSSQSTSAVPKSGADKKERKSRSTLSADDIVVDKHITKVKSMECPKAKCHAAVAKIRKSRSAETAYERKGSFLRSESNSAGGSRGKKEIIVIDSDDYHSFDDSRSDKRSDGSDSVIIVEYRGNRRKKLSKKASSDSRGSQAESEASSFDAPRMKKKELKKRNSAQGYFSKDRIPTIEISEDETYKAAVAGTAVAGDRRCLRYEYSSDERHASGSDLSKTEVINETLEEGKSLPSATGGLGSPMTEDEVEKDVLVVDNNVDKANSTAPPLVEATAAVTVKGSKASVAAEPTVVGVAKENRTEGAISSVKKSVAEKSPILTRLGLSEGSATSQLHQQNLSPLAARRAKSLDTPIVSLHRLPPITSFSSKDDTVDNEEEGVVLEEKTLKQIKTKLHPVAETTTPEASACVESHSAPVMQESAVPAVVEQNVKKSEKSNEPTTETVIIERHQSEDSSSTATATTATTETVITAASAEQQSRLRLSKELKRNSIAALTLFKQSLDMKSAKKTDSETLALSKERSKSEGYEKSLANVDSHAAERKHSTRQERLDSFKKLKNFSIELWESEDVEAAAAAAKIKKLNTSTSKEYDDSVFDEELKSPKSPKPQLPPKPSSTITSLRVSDTAKISSAENDEIPDKELPPPPIDLIADHSAATAECDVEVEAPEPPTRVASAGAGAGAAPIVAETGQEGVETLETPTSERKSLKLNLEGVFTPQQIQEMEIIQGLLNASPTTAESKAIPDKRSFDDEPSSSLSIKPDPLKPYPLESSGSSSVEEAILPADYVDDEELPDVTNLNVMLDSADFLTGAGKSSAALTTSSFGSTGAFFSLSRTLSRISERSTTSEQERTTDMDEDSTKPLSRSLSIDDSIISSDQHPSFSSDPPSGMNLENVFDDDDAAAAAAVAVEMLDDDDDKLDFNIPPPLLSPDEEWPSPPHSAGSVKTPVIDDERYSAAMTTTQSATTVGAKKSEDDDSTTEDNKTLHDEEAISDHEDKAAFARELQRPRGSIGDDTSAGITTSDWSSSTGTTIKLAHGQGTATYYSKSEDNSLAGDYGGLSMSTDTCVASESRKSSTDDLAPIPLEKKYLTLDRKQTSFERRQVFFPTSFPSFEDEYDSPYTESEDTPSSPIPSRVLRKPPPPPRHFQTPVPPPPQWWQQQQQQPPPPASQQQQHQQPQPVTVDECVKTDDGTLRNANSMKKSSSYVSSNGMYNGNQIVVEVETNIPVYKTNGMLPNSYATKFLSKDEISIESPMPELRNISRISNNNEDTNTDTKKKRPSEKAYFIAKELLSTERTYRKDLEVISFWLRDEFIKEDDDLQNFESIDRLLLIIDPIYDAHCVLLREIEIRVSSWDPPYVGDILYNFFENLNLYDTYLEEHWKILEEINTLYASNEKFEMLYREFESQKICYLPLTAFILKPLQRLLHYTQILDNLIKYYGKHHVYYEDCYQAKCLLLNTARHVPNILRKSENLALLYELSRDISGIDSVYVPEREFIRQGCLSKFSQRKGYQQRMFFLFSDLLLYSARSGHTFRVHGQLPLSNVIIEERPDTPQQHSFSIYGGNRVVTVAASSEEEKDKWLEDLTNAIQKCKTVENYLNGGGDKNSLYYFSLKSCNSSDDITDKYEDVNKALAVASQRSNKTVYVCWHRNTSISIDDHLRAVENQLSGFLLRKFKNSNGWQKLWVVFTNFCLFFYKSSQEDCPLAGLPLLGYTISTPAEKDGIQKNFAFKLQFKNHIYFFRAESEYTFNRWMEVIGNATQHSGRHRLFSRKESAHLDISLT